MDITGIVGHQTIEEREITEMMTMTRVEIKAIGERDSDMIMTTGGTTETTETIEMKK